MNNDLKWHEPLEFIPVNSHGPLRNMQYIFQHSAKIMSYNVLCNLHNSVLLIDEDILPREVQGDFP